jgi:hypothetical protein
MPLWIQEDKKMVAMAKLVDINMWSHCHVQGSISMMNLNFTFPHCSPQQSF